MQDGLEKRMLMLEVNDLRLKKPEYYNSWTLVYLQFVLSEINNGVVIAASEPFQEVKDMMKTVFTGYYTYNVEYKIPLLKRHVVISDNMQTNYTDTYRIGKENKIVKINDKMSKIIQKKK